MIQFANTDNTPLVRSMWKTCFGDTDEYLDLHFSKKYKPENTLLFFDGDIAAAALQMLPYTIRFYRKEVPFYYLAGLCTLPRYRNRGYMGQLIKTSFEVMKSRNIPLCGLIPAENWLFDYYTKYGFETVFDATENTIDLKVILQKSKDEKEAYTLFDKQYQKDDFCVLKTFSDFETIVTDYKNEGYPPKGNLKGMARVLIPEIVLSLFAEQYSGKPFQLQIEDCTYEIRNGKVVQTNVSDPSICININFLTKLLFGYQTSQLEPPYSSLFQEHHPIINLMLE